MPNAQRTPFAGNIIPSNRINPIFANIYKDMPLPNQVSVTDPLNLSGNYGVGGVLNSTATSTTSKSTTT